MQAGLKYIFNDNEIGKFFCVTKTLKTTAYAIWHQYAEVKRLDGTLETVAVRGIRR